MKDFIAVDTSGTIVLSGTVHDDDDPAKMVPSHHTVHLVTRPREATHFIEGNFENRTPAPGYRQQRVRAYPSTGDQLDALWKWFEHGDVAAAADMLAQIKAVKAAYPKT